MRYRILLSIIFFLFFCLPGADAQSSIDKKTFFAAMESNKMAMVDAQLKLLESATNQNKAAFEGALLMRKADMVSVPAKKLSLFKQGNRKLEAAIALDKNNAELRFLRLMIQEHAPKSLGYNKNIDEDCKVIEAGYKSLSAITKQTITQYSKRSKALKASAL